MKLAIYLPGTAPIVNQELAAAIGKYHAFKTDHASLTQQLKDAKDELIATCHIPSMVIPMVID